VYWSGSEEGDELRPKKGSDEGREEEGRHGLAE